MAEKTIPRYLALDVGSKRVGIAVSDELGLTAQPVLTLERRRNQREDLRSIARLCRRFGVVGIVVGNPLALSGEPTSLRTAAFIPTSEIPGERYEPHCIGRLPRF